MDDILKVYEEYSEQILFCKYTIAERLKHNAEMGRCGENILIRELKKRFGMLEFVSGFIVCDGMQSPQCDILVCRKNMYKRKLDGDLYLVNPKDCLMVIEVKGNLTLSDIAETNRKNQFFKDSNESKHIQLSIFAFKTRVAKKTLFSEFGYSYGREIKSYYQNQLSEEKNIDLFICLHRESLNTSASRDKQLFFLKDKQNEKQYFLDNNYPVMQNFHGYLQSLQE
ncbi:DUF6602 domain-containing protein [Brevibacillus laterosporus]|uniref:DUF6602 domain-containing protein n=1 Tax=Brevibacillus laterosporus TaxID=1465 RepID=UPI000839C53A|nr:DUF6602 domain-containing protein [Brevibacillus laterosporus]